jgi:Carboxypeptidase regulatory-like domain
MRTVAHVVISGLLLTAIMSPGVRPWSAYLRAASPTIEGVVQDQRGQVLSGASVVVLPEGGGVAVDATTDHDGTYSVTGLIDGSYRVDVWLPGFVGVRRNHVRPRADSIVRVDVVLSVRPVCECVWAGPPPRSEAIAGRVVDETGNPLPFAHLELAGPTYRETAYADLAGRFIITPPVGSQWSLLASDSVFGRAALQVTRGAVGPLVLRLRSAQGANVEDTERFNHECVCPGYFGGSGQH